MTHDERHVTGADLVSGADCRHQHRVYSLSPSTATMAAAGSSAPHTAPHSPAPPPAPPPGYSVTLRPRLVMSD